MSVRIHQISKKVGMENKELIALLIERGYNVKSASSTIDNISAESLIEELGSREKEEPESGDSADGKHDEREESVAPVDQPAAEPDEMESPAPPKRSPGGLPPGVFVKSADQVKKEKEEEKENRRPTSHPFSPPPPPPPRQVSPASPPPPPRPAVRGPSSPATPPPIAKKNPPPYAPPRGADPEKTESSTATAENEDDDEIKVVHIKPPIVVRDFAGVIGLKPFRLISELMEMGIFASMNQTIEEDVAAKVAEKHGFILEVRHRGDTGAAPARKKEEAPVVDESKFLEPRPPVVCILGHVDHGKTTLLDFIRKTKVVAGEAGGITQHIGAYQIETAGQKITFLDTPGHAAFSKMRARGANVTDIAVLVVAADDGFMPQTDEALRHAKAARVPIIVAINKIDTKGANIDKVKQQMQQREIAPEDWGGETVTVPISALEGQGIDHLLEMILLQAEIAELKANPRGDATGTIVESQMEVGRGAVATVIVQKGTLKTGAALVCGPYHAKARAMFDDNGKPLKSAGPSTPVKIIGWSGAPDAGSIFRTVKNERVAKAEAEEAEQELKRKGVEQVEEPKAVSLENLFDAIESTKRKVFRVVVKSDVHGSLEAVIEMLQTIESEKVSLEVVQGEVGMVSRNDVLIASAANAAILGFNVKMEPGVAGFAKHHGVAIYHYNIIYELVDGIREVMAEMLDPEIRENKIGAAEVRQVFPVARGSVAGCMVTEGRIVRDAAARLIRGGKTEFEGRIGTLKRFKDDANEVRAGYECGIQLDGFGEYREGDVIECFEVRKTRSEL